MKHFLFLLLAGLFSSTSSFAQNTEIQHFIEQHKAEPGFTYAFMSKDLFELTAKTEIKDSDWNGLQNVVKNIGSLRILVADSIQNALPLYKEVKALIPEDEFDALLTVRDGKENVRIWAKSENQTVTDLILLVGASDAFVLICFAGNLELGNLAELASLFEAGSAQQLARTAESLSIEFGVSPNPCNGQFTLSYSDESDPPTLLSILDQNGRQLSTLRLSGSSTQQVMLNDLSSGVYWIQMKTQNGKLGMKQIQVVK